MPLTWRASPLRRIHLAASPLRRAHLATHLGEGASAGRRKQQRCRLCSSLSPPSFTGCHHVGLGSLHSGRQGQGEAEGEGSRYTGRARAPRAQDRELGTRPLQPVSVARGFTPLSVFSRVCKMRIRKTPPPERPEPVSTVLLQPWSSISAPNVTLWSRRPSP